MVGQADRPPDQEASVGKAGSRCNRLWVSGVRYQLSAETVFWSPRLGTGRYLRVDAVLTRAPVDAIGFCHGC